MSQEDQVPSEGARVTKTERKVQASLLGSIEERHRVFTTNEWDGNVSLFLPMIQRGLGIRYISYREL